MSSSPFFVVATNELSHKQGLLFYAYAPMAAPYQGGWLCVQQPHHRTSVQDSGGSSPQTDCSGVFSYDFGARIDSGVDPALTAGELVYCQYWSRDPSSSATTNRTDALRFGIAP